MNMSTSIQNNPLLPFLQTANQMTNDTLLFPSFIFAYVTWITFSRFLPQKCQHILLVGQKAFVCVTVLLTKQEFSNQEQVLLSIAFPVSPLHTLDK